MGGMYRAPLEVSAVHRASKLVVTTLELCGLNSLQPGVHMVFQGFGANKGMPKSFVMRVRSDFGIFL